MRRVAGGFAVLAVSTFGSQIIGFIALAVIARRLGPTNLGAYSFAASLTVYFALAAHLGVTIVGTRDVIRTPTARTAIVRDTLILQAALGMLSYGFLFLLAPVLAPSASVARVLPITGLVVVLNALSCSWLLQADRRFVTIGVATFVGQVVYATVALPFVGPGLSGVESYAWFNVLGLGVTVAIVDMRSLRVASVSLERPNARLLVRRLRNALPVALGLALVQIYVTIGSVMLGYLSTGEAVGEYAIAYRLPLALITIVGTWATALFPHTAELMRDGDRDGLARDVSRAAGVTLCLSVPTLASATIVATPLMTLMFGDGYSAAGPTFVLLTGVALIVAVSVNFGNTMVAIGRERVFVVGTAIGAAVSVVTNFALIPILGAPGAAIGSIVAELCVLLYMLRRFQNSVAAVHWPLADLGIAVVITAVVSIGVILTLQAWGVIAALFVAAGGNAGLWYLSDLCSVRSALDWRRLSRGVT